MSLQLDDDERLLSAHIADLERISRKSGVPRFSAFLNEREQRIADSAAEGEISFFGGYEGASRKLCAFFGQTYGEDMTDEDRRGLYPIVPVTFGWRKSDSLTHRDILGALMALGIKRGLLGDILAAECYAIVFVHETAAELVLAVDKIGRVGVSCSEGINQPLPQQKTQSIATTVSSLRLDCIVSAAANISREKSASLIKSGLVNADFSPCTDTSAVIKENTIISIRGSGRYRLSEICGETRKGRISIKIDRYV